MKTMMPADSASQEAAVAASLPSLLTIFWTFFKIGAFTFGGGYAMISLIEQELVQRHKWVEPSDFMDAVAGAQFLPGAIAVNVALFTGHKVRGAVGALTATLGVVLPSYLVISVIAAAFGRFSDLPMVHHFLRGAHVVVVSLIFAAVMRIGRRNLDAPWKWAAVFVGLGAILFLNIHPVVVVLAAAGAGILFAR
ncbi:MAG: chromate transporter [Firmicutes bacterium]|nr:chromate transporter [Bacillota bacterium]